MTNKELYKLNEVLLGLEKVLERYKHYLNKFLTDNSKLIETPIGQEIMKVFLLFFFVMFLSRKLFFLILPQKIVIFVVQKTAQVAV